MVHEKFILLVEDNPDDELLTLRALKKNNIRNEVVVARDGAEALDFLFGEGQYAGRDTAHQPQLIMLDLNLPKINGIDVLKRLREHPRTKLLPVIILTTSKEECDIVDSYSCGANSYIRKPVDLPQFVEAMGQVGVYWLVLNIPPPSTAGHR